MVSQHGNDEQNLGAHDANLLYVARDRYDFGSKEIDGLAGSGLALYAQENAPAWYWLQHGELDRGSLLTIFATISSMPTRRAGALAAMALTEEPVPTDLFLSRKELLELWVSEKAPGVVKLAALRYLGDCGTSSDIAILRPLLETSDSQARRAAAEAITRIQLRNSHEHALDALIEIQVQYLHPPLVARVFSSEAEFPSDKLTKALEHPNSEVRRLAATLLGKRKELPDEWTEKLLVDPDTAVRYEGLMAAVRAGRKFSDEEAKRVLLKASANIGVLGLFGRPLPEDESYLKRYKAAMLGNLSDEQLEQEAKVEAPLSIDAQMALAKRHFRRFATRIRRAVDDRYASEFREALERAVTWMEPETLAKLRDLEGHLRKRFTQQSLEVIGRKGDRTDLRRVRELMNVGETEYSETLVRFLAKNGEWSDIPLIIEFVERRRPTGSLLGSVEIDNQRYQLAADAVYILGKTRLDELLAIHMPDSVIQHVVLVIGDRMFRGLPDDTILRLLESTSDGVRKTTALKCVKSLNQNRVAQLLHKYLGLEHRYYNVIHWLDLVSLPSARARRAAEKALKNETGAL